MAAKCAAPWCFEILSDSQHEEGQDVRKQLVAIMAKYHMDVTSCGKDLVRLRKCIVAGYFTNICKKDPNEGYKTLLEGQPVFIHPSSSLFNRNPEWLLYHDFLFERIHAQCYLHRPKVAHRDGAEILSTGRPTRIENQNEGEDRAAIRPLQPKRQLAPQQAQVLALLIYGDTLCYMSI